MTCEIGLMGSFFRNTTFKNVSTYFKPQINEVHSYHYSEHV